MMNKWEARIEKLLLALCMGVAMLFACMGILMVILLLWEHPLIGAAVVGVMALGWPVANYIWD
jgi:hypothetical protein